MILSPARVVEIVDASLSKLGSDFDEVDALGREVLRALCIEAVVAALREDRSQRDFRADLHTRKPESDPAPGGPP